MLILIRGGGDLATGVAVRLIHSGLPRGDHRTA